jgi:hypothetical protein
VFQLSYAVLLVPGEVIESSFVGCPVNQIDNQIDYSWSPLCLLQDIINQVGLIS